MQNYNNVHAYISKIILQVLSKDSVDTESIFTFSLYLQMMLLKNCFRENKKAKLAIDSILNLPISKEIDKQEAELLFTTNRKLLIEIYNDVWGGAYSQDLKWLEGGEKIFGERLRENHYSFQNFIEFTQIFNSHLMTSHKESLIIWHLIRRTLQSV